MRILHIDTERGWRGGERQTLWLAEELQRRNHDSIIAARRREPLAKRAGRAGLQLVLCEPRFEADPHTVLQLARFIGEAQVDLVHAHTAHALGLAALATVLIDTPLVASRRVDFHLRANLATRWKYGRTDALIAVSQAVADVLAADRIAMRKIAVVPDGTDVHRSIEPASHETLVALGIEPTAPLVVQVAQLVPHKDPLNFVYAIAAARQRVPGLQAVLVGDGPLRRQVVHAVHNLGLDDTLRVAGYRSDADELLAAADVVVLSSREEGMGSVLLDAFLLGKPIAATYAGGIPEVVEHGSTGLLAPVGNSAALAENITTLIENTAIAARFGCAGRARAADFSVERMADRTLAVYDRALAHVPVEEADATNCRTDAVSIASSASSTHAL